MSRSKFIFFPLLIAVVSFASQFAAADLSVDAPEDLPAIIKPTAKPLGNPVAVPVGGGSYASFPPSSAGKTAEDRDVSSLHIDNLGNRPVPTNHWWTNMIIDGIGGQLWSFPLMVKTTKEGVQVYYPTRWNEAGTDPVSEFPLTINGVDFQATDARAVNWGDWTYTFRYLQDDDHSVNVTLGRGMPFAWFEFHGIVPTITPTLSGGAGLQTFGLTGSPVSLPFTGETLGLQYGGRQYAVFAPDNTRFESTSNGSIACRFSGAGHYLVVCPLPARTDIVEFHKYAFAIPRDSKLTWFHDADKARVVTAWKVTTEPLKGAETQTIQGWLPHHWRIAGKTLTYDNLQYMTPRGTMKCAVGNEFRLYYPFTGLVAMDPAPHQIGLTHDYDESRMRGYLSGYAANKTNYGDDTYWGGKSLTQLGLYMLMAQQMHDPSFDRLESALRTALTDWYTFTPGENAHYFAAYPNWHAMIGFHSSYGSETFNDNHFHYGYFTYASAMLGMADPQFIKNYGPMARMVAKEYANWDRADTSFPFFRTFDIWEGHSWAGGYSGGTGDNQESSSEAMQSWGGLFLLGSVMGDKEMESAGAMGYAMESQAVDEYWFNRYGDNFSANFKHPLCSMVWSGGNLYGNYFSGDPAWNFAIQWLPMSPMMTYLARDPGFVTKSVATMFTEHENHEHKTAFEGMGSGIGNVIINYAAMGDPDWAAAQYDSLWASMSPIAHDNDTGGIGYYLTHSWRGIGNVAWDYHTDVPTSTVYFDKRTSAFHYVAYNPTDAAISAKVYHGDDLIGHVAVPAHELVSVSKLAP